MPRYNHTKVVVTLGPSSTSETVLARLVEAGADVFRINMSHIGPEPARELIARVRAVSPEVAVLIDTKGPELRTTDVEGEVILQEGSRVELRAGAAPGASTAAAIQIQHEGLIAHLQRGQRIFLDDGLLQLEVVGVSETGAFAECLVARGGRLTSRRGVNIPGVSVFPPELTAADEAAIWMAGTVASLLDSVIRPDRAT